MTERNPQGRTNYDWLNGMRVGVLAGGLVGVLTGWALGTAPFLFTTVGAAVGGFLGARFARRW